MTSRCWAVSCDQHTPTNACRYQKMSSAPPEDTYVVINKGDPLIPGSTEDWRTHPHLEDTPPNMKDTRLDMKDMPPVKADTPTDIPATCRDTSKSGECL